MASARRWARIGLAAAMVSAPGACRSVTPEAARPPAPEPVIARSGRGRDPWVFRCLFEERTRMLVIAPCPKVWFAYSIPTGALYKAWQGDMDFRGKVWDFSQNSSRAKGQTLLSWPNDLARLPDKVGGAGGGGDAAPGWTAESVTYKDKNGWSFSGPGATLTSPVFNAEGWTRLFIAYEEISRKSPVRVEVSTDGGRTWDAQWFDSTMHGSRDDEWQWGFKQIAVEPSAAMRVRFRQPDSAFAKGLRNVRVFGDHVAWWTEHDGRAEPAAVSWVGHELVKKTDGIVLRLKVGAEEPKAAVLQSFDATSESGRVRLIERVEVAELPKGTCLRVMLPGLGTSGTRECSVPGAIRAWRDGEALFIDRSGVYELVSTFPGSETASPQATGAQAIHAEAKR